MSTKVATPKTPKRKIIKDSIYTVHGIKRQGVYISNINEAWGLFLNYGNLFNLFRDLMYIFSYTRWPWQKYYILWALNIKLRRYDITHSVNKKGDVTIKLKYKTDKQIEKRIVAEKL